VPVPPAPDVSYTTAVVDEKAAEALRHVAEPVLTAQDGAIHLLVVLDGASTVGVVEDERWCVSVKTANIYVKTGGQGKPTIIHCTKIGLLPISMVVEGRSVQINVPVRIIPGFGCNIIPECFFLKKRFDVSKSYDTVSITDPTGKLVMQGKALHYDPGSWLFYIRVRLDPSGAAPPDAIVTPDRTYAILDAYAEDELQSLLPVRKPEAEACHATQSAGDVKTQASMLRLWHERLGHRNHKDVAALLGLPAPAQAPKCLVCLAANSKRSALTGSEGIHDGIRPGYAWSWDHAGPFKTKTWSGKHYFSLKVDINTGKLAPSMVSSTGNCEEEWIAHVRRLKAHFGRQVTARLITDSAPYFVTNTKLASFNEQEGIVHVASPPYTQELNGVAERTIGTVLGMTRAALHQSQLPEASYGECMIAMCVTLEALPHRRGGTLTRREKWEGRLMPRQRERIKVWGCAAYLHKYYGPRGTIGPAEKLGPRAELCVLVGYDPNGMGYRIAQLPSFTVRTSVHVTFVEDNFPCRTNLNRELGGFMTTDQLLRYAGDADDNASDYARQLVQAAMPNSRGRDRPRRDWKPSRAQLQSIAAGAPTPPEEDAQAHFTDIVGEAFPFYHDNCHATSDAPSSVPAALAGLDADAWIVALNREVSQHEKIGTLGPPIDPKDLPPGCKAIPLDVLPKLKRDGIKKMRAIIKGFRMTEGIDYNETFAPVPCMSTIRMELAITAKYDLEAKQGDVNTAFLSADMDTEVYVAVPNWFRSDATGSELGYTVRRLLKGIPGIPQGPRLWHKKSNAIYLDAGLKQHRSEFCVYYCLKRRLTLIVWVDDLFLFFPKAATTEAEALWTHLRKHMDLDEWDDIDDCLSCIVRRDRPNRTITLSQEPAIRKLLQRLDMQDANGKDTPMTAGAKLTKKDCPGAEQAAVMVNEQRWYRSTVASLIYFVGWTRPDLALVVSQHCKYMHNPGHVHITSLKRVLRYLKQTANYGLKYDFSTAAAMVAKVGVYGFYDAAHADCLDTMKSTLAYAFFFENCPISWHSKLHSYITTSTNHSEYCAAAKAAKEAKKWEKYMTERGLTQFVRPIDLFSDSKGCIAMTYNPVQRSASKHVDLADHYAREQQERGTITITFVGTKDMIADVLTKHLPYADFKRHAAKLVHPINL
jgi:histone deacetylase 1/2